LNLFLLTFEDMVLLKYEIKENQNPTKYYDFTALEKQW